MALVLPRVFVTSRPGVIGSRALRWAIGQTLGPNHLLAGLFAAGVGTARDVPHEYVGLRQAVRDPRVGRFRQQRDGGRTWSDLGRRSALFPST